MDGNLGIPLKELPEIKTQKRGGIRTYSMPEWKICGADTETIEGRVWLFSTSKGVWEIDTLDDLLRVLYGPLHGRKWQKGKNSGKGKTLKGISTLNYFFWNLKFDVQAIIKLLDDEDIDTLLRDEDVRVKTPSGIELDLHYLTGKYFRIKPVKWYIGDYKVGPCEWWDISQFYGKMRLNNAAKKYLNKSKLEKCFDDSILDASRFDEKEYRDLYYEDILKYAVLDAVLAEELAVLKRGDFVQNDIRFIKPYSLANVSQRAALSMDNIPTIHPYTKSPKLKRLLQMASTSYSGGWFETTGSGFIPNCVGVDLASAYPYVMAHLPDTSKGYWVGGDEEEAWWNWMETREPFSLGFCEVSIVFKEGLNWHPLVKKSPTGTLVSPRIIRGWFTADEIAEAKQWPHESFIVGEWVYFREESAQNRPYRKFIERFYKMKMSEDKDTPAYQVSKIMINSIYGKTCQAINNQAGKLWNPFYAATITGGTRARLAEINRLNGYSAVSFATDGVIFKEEDFQVIPPRPKDALFNLGEWEEDGAGDLLLIMSGVYSMKMKEKTKTVFRGSAAYFLLPFKEDGLFGFCAEESQSSVVRCTKSIPYTAKEARIRSDYSLINVFREQKFSIKPTGDSTKRLWPKVIPQTFGDLSTKWYESSPHERVKGLNVRG